MTLTSRNRNRRATTPGTSRHRRLPAAGLAGAVLLVAGLQAGCGGSTAGRSGASSSGGANGAYPVTVSDCGTSVTYDRAPSRAVSNDINTTEDMLALGLEPRMVGDFGVDGDGPVAKPVPTEYLAAFHQVRDISPDYFTLEKLVSLRPDFLFAGWNYGLQVGTTLTPDNLAKYGIKTLALTESCAHVEKADDAVSIDDTYQDLRNLGAIFGVESRAQQVIAQMQSQVSSVQAKLAGQPRVTVFDYDSGESAPFTGPGLAMPNALIGLAGGTNIFASLKQTWTSVSWEPVVAADPECIIINDYGTPTAAEKEQFLETSPITENLTAVKNHCFLPLSYDEVTPGPRNAEAVVALAHWLHPTQFGLPADGS